MNLNNLYKKINALSDIHKQINSSVKEIDTWVIGLVQEQMYEHGIMDGNNPSSILQYAVSTERQKKRKAKFPRVDHITLRWEGDFHKSIKIKYNEDSIELYSEDEKWVKWLSTQERFEGALRLTDENLSSLRTMVKQIILNRYRDAIQSA